MTKKKLFKFNSKSKIFFLSMNNDPHEKIKCLLSNAKMQRTKGQQDFNMQTMYFLTDDYLLNPNADYGFNSPFQFFLYKLLESLFTKTPKGETINIDEFLLIDATLSFLLNNGKLFFTSSNYEDMRNQFRNSDIPLSLISNALSKNTDKRKIYDDLKEFLIKVVINRLKIPQLEKNTKTRKENLAETLLIILNLLHVDFFNIIDKSYYPINLSCLDLVYDMFNGLELGDIWVSLYAFYETNK